MALSVCIVASPEVDDIGLLAVPLRFPPETPPRLVVRWLGSFQHPPLLHRGCCALASMLPTERHSSRSSRTVELALELSYSFFGGLAIAGMPSHLPPGKHNQSRAPFLQRVILHAFAGTTDPSDSLPTPRTFGLRPYMLGLCPTRPPARSLLFPLFFLNVPPGLRPRGESSARSGPECCLLPSPCHEKLGSPKHLSADNLSRLLRSLMVAAR